MGTPNASSSPSMTEGGSAADEERISRSELRLIRAMYSSFSPRIAWCIVGTPVNQVGLNSSSPAKKTDALKPGVHTTLAPATTEESNAPINP